jgi:hypothetical protein
VDLQKPTVPLVVIIVEPGKKGKLKMPGKETMREKPHSHTSFIESEPCANDTLLLCYIEGHMWPGKFQHQPAAFQSSRRHEANTRQM